MEHRMRYQVEYHQDVKKRDLPLIDKKNKEIIKRAIEDRLMLTPEIYAKPLRHTLKGYWKLRVRDYRIVFRISEDAIHVLAILHRKNVYAIVEKRV